MSLHPRPIDPIPEATARIARQAFPKGNRYILLRDELGTIYTDAEFAPLFSVHGQSALSPWRLALIEELESRKIGFRSLQENIDTTTSGGKLIFHLFGALAEFERNLICERTHAGLAAARARGRKGGRRQKLTAQEIEIGKSLAADPNRSVTSICEHLKISRLTYYRYINPEVKLEVTAEPTVPTIKTTQVWLWLRVENNNKFIHRKKKVREHIEQFCLTRYQMKKKKTDGYEYELTFTYEDDADLDKQIYDLLQDMDFQADLDCCFIEADMREIGTDRSW